MFPDQVAARLDAFAADLHSGAGGREITAVTHDSRQVGPGYLYCCVPGSRVDGHDFAEQAVRDGAVALLCERLLPLDVPQIVVTSVREAMAPAAAAIYADPSSSVKVVGVTGTNGKTTVTHLLGEIFASTGTCHELIGTLTGARTTPESPEVQSLLAAARDRGVQVVAMEVSSHALAQHRVDGVKFSAAGFTNLSPDHLEFHETMEAYFEAKALLFVEGRAQRAVVCVDDDAGSRMRERAVANGIETIVVSTDEAEPVTLRPAGSSFDWRGHRVEMPVPGRFNVANALVAAELAVAVGVDEQSVVNALSTATSARGRVESIDAGQGFAVLVDYAHTPDGLSSVIAMARETTDGQVIVVFGCGGDRDTAKRPMMGAIAAETADVAILTTDNPRSEDPVDIAADVLAGVGDPQRLRVEHDRKRAIEVAVHTAEPGDVVIIAGKGHETTQVFADGTVDFDDRAVALAALQALVNDA